MTHQNLSSFYEFTFPKHSDTRGDLVPIELNKELPFIPKRVYFLQNTPKGTTRGAHCHWVEEEVFVCVSGSITALIDFDGTGKKKFILDDPQKAIYIGKEVWHEFTNFSEDAVLLALSSVHYMPGDENYEWDYEKFCEMKKEI